MRFTDANYIGTEQPSEWLTFDDVLLLPQASSIPSRRSSELKTSASLTETIELDTPIISANMDTVTDSNMALNMFECGGYGILHRFHSSPEEYFDQITKVAEKVRVPGFSIGNNPDDIYFVQEAIKRFGKVLVCVDVANGHQRSTIEQVSNLRNSFDYDSIEIVAGNVGTPAGVAQLVNAGADAVKVGIGPGSLCTTRKITGHGVPQLSAILQARRAIFGMQKNVKIIADGGIRNSGDIVKALAAGADTVMIGNLFAGTDEAPGELISQDGQLYKKYRGQASRDFMDDYGKQGVAPEGEDMLVASKGPLRPLMEDLVMGLRSGMTYSGARNLNELYEVAQFIRVSNHAFVEGTAHGKQN